MFQNSTLCRLAVYKDEESGLLMCGGRIQLFNGDKAAVPHDAWTFTFLAHEAHNANHDEIAATLLRMRNNARVVKARRLAKKIVDSCIICRKARAKICKQIMGDLPLERTEPVRPFEFTTADLFGPYEVKD